MPALDSCHPQVVRAMQKAGWVVDPQPAQLATEDRSIYIDVLATRQANGDSEQILLAEIKCFANKQSATTDLYTAIGQYLLYQAVLDELLVNISLFLVVPERAFATLFDLAVRRVLRDHNIRLVIVNMDEERIVQWIP